MSLADLTQVKERQRFVEYVVNVNSLSHIRRSTRKLRTEVRPEQIAQAALVLISRRGLNELNIGALAKEVSLVPSAVPQPLKFVKQLTIE